MTEPRPFFAVLSLLAILVASRGALAQPSLAQAVPAAILPGGDTEIDLVGGGFEGDLRFWTSFPAQVSVVSQQADRVRCRLSLPADSPVGIGAILVANAKGISDTFWLVVDDLPSVAETAGNHRLEAAQQLTVPTAVDGAADGTEPDYFRVALKAGQRLSAEVLAARLNSTGDPVLRLLDVNGRELAYVDDDESLGAEGRLLFTAPQDGDYVLELRDNKYQSGPRYRLRLGDFPRISTAYPLGIRRGSTTLVTFPGQPTDIVPAAIAAAAYTTPDLVQTIVARRTDGASWSWGQIVVSDFQEELEAEPNDEPGQANRVAIPCAVNGILQDDGDLDLYEFAAKQGQRLVLRTISRDLGSPAYPFLRLFDAAGKLLADSAIGEGEELTLAYAIPADGVYRLQVDELAQRSGADYTYRVEIDDRPFSLILKPANESQYRVAVPSGDGAMLVDVQCQRNGYDGPIALAWNSPQSGVRAFNATIPAGANEHRLYLAPAPDVTPGTLLPGRIVGRAAVGDRMIEAPVATLPLLQTRLAAMVHPPRWHDGLYWIGTVAAAEPLFKVSVEEKALVLPATGGETTAVLRAERVKADFKDPLAVVTGELPTGITFETKAEGDAFTLTIRLATMADTPRGVRPLRLGVFGTFQGRHQLVALELPVSVGEPTSAPSGTP